MIGKIVGIVSVVVVGTMVLGSMGKNANSGRQTASNEAFRECVRKGVIYYKDIGSYPRLSDGRLAEDVVFEKCSRSLVAFG